jgi:hypothetical protein
VNKGVNIPPWGQISPLGARGKGKNGILDPRISEYGPPRKTIFFSYHHFNLLDNGRRLDKVEGLLDVAGRLRKLPSGVAVLGPMLWFGKYFCPKIVIFGSNY